MFGWFSKRREPKPLPVIEFDGLRVERTDGGWWFAHGRFDFMMLEDEFICPSRERLDALVAEVEAMWPQLHAAVKAWADQCNLDVPPTEPDGVTIDITQLASEGTYEVSWDGLESWGDYGFNLVIKDGRVIDQWAGD